MILTAFIVGIILLAVCGGFENIERKKRANMTYKEYLKLKQQGRL